MGKRLIFEAVFMLWFVACGVGIGYVIWGSRCV